ncbi:MAG TPA: hypothetical protein VE465_01445 [Streptosporangiaceae bacterium]|nr:hypothetical protein [Streptosporangiaceae bacterium]
MTVAYCPLGKMWEFTYLTLNGNADRYARLHVQIPPPIDHDVARERRTGRAIPRAASHRKTSGSRSAISGMVSIVTTAPAWIGRRDRPETRGLSAPRNPDQGPCRSSPPSGELKAKANSVADGREVLHGRHHDPSPLRGQIRGVRP